MTRGRKVPQICHICNGSCLVDWSMLNRLKRKGRRYQCWGCGQQKRKYKIGNEVMKGGRLHVVVGLRDDGKRHKIRSKAVIEMEKVFGRKLTKNEKVQIRYVDGDTRNCNIYNLYLREGVYTRICAHCGDMLSTNDVVHSRRKSCKQCLDKSIGRDKSIYIQGLVEIVAALRKVKISKVCRWFQVSESTVRRIWNREGPYSKEFHEMTKKDVWKALLTQHDKLVKRSGSTLYDRITLLKRVYEDADYLVAMKEESKSPAGELDNKVSDTCANFTELLQMLKMFPNPQQWENGNLNTMRMEMHDQLRKDQQARRNEKDKGKEPKIRERKSATISEVRELKQEVSVRQTEVDTLRNQLQMANQYIKTLESQLDVSRQTIGSLNETVSLLRLDRTRGSVAS